MATPTGFEPAISSVTGRRDNHFTTESCLDNRGNHINSVINKQVPAMLKVLVGDGGFEPPTSTTSMWRSSQMS
jgi:hypothetical protein